MHVQSQTDKEYRIPCTRTRLAFSIPVSKVDDQVRWDYELCFLFKLFIHSIVFSSFCLLCVVLSQGFQCVLCTRKEEDIRQCREQLAVLHSSSNDQLLAAKSTWLEERASLLEETAALLDKRAALQEERDALLKEKAVWLEERAALVAEKDELIAGNLRVRSQLQTASSRQPATLHGEWEEL